MLTYICSLLIMFVSLTTTGWEKGSHVSLMA